MSDRGLLFLFSILMIAAGLGVAVGWLATGQAGTVDGLFFGVDGVGCGGGLALYAVFLLRRAMEAGKPPAKVSQASVKSPAAKPAAVGQPERPAAGVADLR